MIALGLQLRNARIPETRNPIASTPFVLKFHRGIVGYELYLGQRSSNPLVGGSNPSAATTHHSIYETTSRHHSLPVTGPVA
ncbi:hypothetical protein ES703_54022 [subsurface metagenome]